MDIEQRREKARIRQREWRSKNKRKAYPHSELSTHAKANLKERLKVWRKNNPDITNAATRRYRKNVRTKALARLGNACVLCGFDNPLALELDHIEPLHGQPRFRQSKVAKLINEGSTAYQILCANCNTIKELNRWNG
jgi:hypothetical protein